jgi:putative redox protein
MADNRTVTARIGRDAYKTELQTSAHTIHADEPIEVGGTNFGPTPGDLLRMSLASCTAITLRMYADRKKWDVEQIQVTVSDENQKYKTVFQCIISVRGNLSEVQRKRLLEIAHACPVHKVLANPIEVETKMAPDPIAIAD